MESYNIQIKPSAVKEINAIPSKTDRLKIIQKINSLSSDPRPINSQKLSGSEKYRIRQGNYRILYAIEEKILIVIVVKVGHRKEVYRHIPA